MMPRPYLRPLDSAGRARAQHIVAHCHYLRRPVDSRCSVEGYAVELMGVPGVAGWFLLGRPQATSCYPWYGSVEDVRTGRAAVTRWQVLNLARIWFRPDVQPGGDYHRPHLLPGFIDRRGTFRSTLVSAAIAQLAARVGSDYLLRRPPCFLDEPYEIRWLLSYCDTRLHRGTVYRASGFERWRVNAAGVETWRLLLPPLTADEDAAVRAAAAASPRSRAHRARRAQLELTA